MKKYLLISLLIVCNSAVNAAQSNRWKMAMKKIDNAVISIKINAVRAFDTEGNKTTQATGFVVDAERGIILTNRHVVNPGPITAKGVFSNREEVALVPIYRDPVHDFGFFKYDPKALKFMRPEALKLAPRTAQPGDEIRVVGNDSGEHMSILSATLARLDRSAPKYGAGGYSDFNTFYFQSAADTSGGSSGSPVINDKAEVLALNAGGQFGSASSYFLPLYKITRALKAVQQGEQVVRGTIQATLNYQTYDEVKRLGLTSELESKIRQHNSGSGILTVAKVVKNGPTHDILKPGDIILSLKSESKTPDSKSLPYVTRYEHFEIFLDEHVGQNIELQIFRQDKVLTKTIRVQDLHSITPSEYLEIAGGIFNNVSYQIARQSNLAIEGVFVAVPGFMFGKYGIPRGAIIQQLNGKSIRDLNDLKKELSQLSQGQFFNIKYVTQRSPLYASVASIKFQTNWHISNQCHRNDQTGIWPCEKISWNKKSIEEKITEVKFKRYSDKNTNRIAPSLVWINSDLPYHLDGQRFAHYSGTGLILDTDSGLVVADRNTVPINMLQVTITVGGVAEIPAQVLFVNPLHGYVLLQYDPKLLGKTKVKSALFNDDAIEVGDKLQLVGYQKSDRIISEILTVTSAGPLSLPYPRTPAFKDTNVKHFMFNNPPLVSSGVLLDKKGKVRSWWTNFTSGGQSKGTFDIGLPIRHIKEMRDSWLKHKKIDVYSLEVELFPVTISNARNIGLPEEWIKAYQDKSSDPHLLKVINRVAGSDSFKKLQQGDILLSIDSKIIWNFEILEQQIQNKTVLVSVWRDGKQLDLDINPQILSENYTDQIYLWSGALIQKPHRAVAAQYSIEAKGVFVSWFWYGSPANQYKLAPLSRIVEFEGEEVKDLQGFIALSKKYQNRDYVRIRLLDLIGRQSIITLKQDPHYWPTQKIHQVAGQWINELVD